jgi:hypothetical protein
MPKIFKYLQFEQKDEDTIGMYQLTDQGFQKVMINMLTSCARKWPRIIFREKENHKD